MSARQAGIIGIAGILVFCVALAVFGAVREDYSHLNLAISLLGVIGSPYATAWNVIGFMLPGLCLATCGAGIAMAVDGKKGIFWWLLVLSALAFSGTGVLPAELDGRRPDFDSPYTQGHILMSVLSALFWIPAAWLAPFRAVRNPSWRQTTTAWIILAALATLGMAVSIFADYLPFLNEHDGLVQRIAFATYFLWYSYAAYALIRFQSDARFVRSA